MASEHKQDLFFVRRNTNRNEVHYAIATTVEDHAPAGRYPVSGYWQMHEKGPGVIEPITIFEQLAFGIKSQSVVASSVEMVLNALPERKIKIEPNAMNPGQYKSKITISGEQAELISFYAHAEMALFVPKVKYIEIHGMSAGEAVMERIDF